MSNQDYHKPVMLHESVAGLRIIPAGRYADVTFGGGGHSSEILSHLSPQGHLYGFDQDPDAVNNAPNDDRFTLIRSNFRYLRHYMKYHQAIPLDGILADLGVSSYQFDNPDKGFSIRKDGPLDLRMNPNASISASEVIKTYSERDLARIFKTYGEIKSAGFLAKIIGEKRKTETMDTTMSFIEKIARAIPRNKENQFLAQVFQALRIEVNQELEALKEMLSHTIESLRPGGRLVVISYHSLEDRLVKNFLKSGNFEGKIEKDFYGNIITPFKTISRKPITPSEEELKINNRSRSAKLRIAEKLNSDGAEN